MKILALLNPVSGKRKSEITFNSVSNNFEKAGISLDIKTTAYKNHAVKILKDLDLSNYDGLISIGGDGTLYEVINGIHANKHTSKIPVGILPVGTGNAFAREIGLTDKPFDYLINSILNKKTREVDLGKFTSDGKVNYFSNIIGLGFVADVVKTAQPLKFMGSSAYTLGVIYHLIKMNTYNLKLTIDDKVLERENIFVEVSNTKYTGKDFFMAPDAEINDGLLNITLLNKANRMTVVGGLQKIFKGIHIQMKEVETFVGKKIKIETDIKKVLTPDGELVSSTPVEIECLANSLEVYV